MGKPRIIHGTRGVDADDAAAFGVPRAEVSETWIEHVLDGDDWMVAARVVPDPNGNAVIGELRVFPYEPKRPAGFAGQWSAAALGGRAPVPRGGLPGTLLHRGIKLSHYERLLRNTFGIVAQLAGLPETSPGRQALEQFKEAGFRLKPRSPFGRQTADRRRGRQPVPAMEYARLARDYVATTEHPIATLAKQWEQSPAWVTSRIARARRYGFLTQAVKPGVKGGSLTEKAEAALKSARPKNMPKTRQRE
jgi:hypothetical protein